MDNQNIENLKEEEQMKYVEYALQATTDLETRYMDEKSAYDEQEINCIDIFSLRIISLLVCRGKPQDKAQYLSQFINQGSDEY